MRELTTIESKSIAGADYSVSTYDEKNNKYVTVSTPVTNPNKLVIDMGTAATLGATAGLLGGGPVGAFTGAIFGAAGVAIATMVTDAYNMYEAAKKK